MSLRLLTNDRSWIERAEKCQAQGFPGTNSKRWTHYVEGVFPSHVKRAQGCTLTDAWGKSYVDFVSGLGTNLLGYDHPTIAEAVRKGLHQYGMGSWSLPSTLEVEVSELLQERFPFAEKWRFFKNGDDATRAAIRIARAATGRGEVVSEGYHGSSDLWTSLTPPAHGIRDKFRIQKGGLLDDAIFICEPLELNSSTERREELLESKKRAAVTIFDEVVTALRVPEYSVSQWWGVHPDLICLGKALGNGFPLSAVGGRRELMDAEYFLSTTFSGEVTSLVAAKAVLSYWTQDRLRELCVTGDNFRDKFNEVGRELGIELKGYGTRAMLDTEHAPSGLFMQEMCKAGFLFGKAWFWNYAHAQGRVENVTLSVMSDVCSRIRRGEARWEGIPPRPSFVR